MMDDHDLDEALRKKFGALKQQDELRAPSFTSILERARSAAQPSAIAAATVAPQTHQRWRPSRVLTWGAPLLVAAGLAAVFLQVESSANREFEQSVSEWTRTSNTRLRSPTDGLLSLPGSEYLRSTSVIGTSRSRSPS